MTIDEPKLRAHYADPPQDISLNDIDLARIPRHVSIIMDGNGRWAKARGWDRSRGHEAGVDSLREAVTTSVRLGVDVLSAYAFSTENWRRPQREVDLLMHLFATTLIKELPLFHQEKVRLRFFGDLEALPQATREVNYGSRAEIVRAARQLATEAAAGKIDPASIDDETLADRLYTTGLPDPDLLIRTSGELRLSNYLLWQLAYTELYVTDVLWPDFTKWDYLRAVRAYQSRARRYGGVVAR